jgi:ABC-type nitrate/sulfonate/bicarbonate transport system substrate-binding protein
VVSGLDQPIVIANSNYHVGQERSVRVAEEQGFLTEEGLDSYVYLWGGLVPGRWEFDALGDVMWERGVDIATAVDVRAAVLQRSRGQDVYIVGGWRLQLAPRLIGSKGMKGPEDLPGKRVGVREKWGLAHIGLVSALSTLGLDPEHDIEWVEDPIISYGGDAAEDLLRSGKIDVLPLNGSGADHLIDEGYPVVLDLQTFYRQRGAWPPGKVIVTTRQTIEQRAQDLEAFLRGNLRGFWFVQDPNNTAYMFDLESRMRQRTFNEDERRLRMVKERDEPSRPAEDGPLASGHMPMDGLVPRPALQSIIDGMVQAGEIDRPLPIDNVLKDAASIAGLQSLITRGLIDQAAVDRWRGVRSWA